MNEPSISNILKILEYCTMRQNGDVLAKSHLYDSAHFYVRIRFRHGVGGRPSWLYFGVRVMESDHTIHTETQTFP